MPDNNNTHPMTQDRKKLWYSILAVVIVLLIVLFLFKYSESNHTSQATKGLVVDSVVGLKSALPAGFVMDNSVDTNGLTAAERDTLYSDYPATSLMRKATLIASLTNSAENEAILIKRSATPISKEQCFQSYPMLSYADIDSNNHAISNHITIDHHPFIYLSGDDSDMSTAHSGDIYRGIANGYCVLIDIYSKVAYPNTPEYDSTAKFQEYWSNVKKKSNQINQWVRDIKFSH